MTHSYQLGNFIPSNANRALGILRNHISMRGMLWIVAFIALATTLDASLNGGFYTQSLHRMLAEIALWMHIG
jgi:hypothetical protein